MAGDPRYASGGSLETTAKEAVIESIDGMLSLDDDTFIALKKVPEEHLRRLKGKIAEYGTYREGIGEAKPKPKKEKVKPS